MQYAYLVSLLFSLLGMVVCDKHWELAFFYDQRRAAVITVGLTLVFFLWDAFGIATGSFSRGTSPFMTGLELAPEMPLEEPVFLFFLAYLTINITSVARRYAVGREG